MFPGIAGGHAAGEAGSDATLLMDDITSDHDHTSLGYFFNVKKPTCLFLRSPKTNFEFTYIYNMYSYSFLNPPD